MTLLEWGAALTAALGIWLAIREQLWSWPLTLASCVLYAVFFTQERLYADATLQIGYAALCVVGWRRWHHGQQVVGSALPITRATTQELLRLTALTVVGTLAWGGALAAFTDAAVPWLDAGLAIVSMAGQWLLTRKRLENWLVWMGADAAYLALYLWRGYWPTAALFVVLLGLAALGWRRWRQELVTPAA